MLVAFAVGICSAAEAQVDCTPRSMSGDYGGPLSRNGISLISPAGDHFVSDSVRNGAIGKWTGENGCAENQRPPLFDGAVSNTEIWTVRQGRYTDFPNVVTNVRLYRNQGVCGVAPKGASRTIYIFNETGCKREWRKIEILAHELGHAMRLGHTARDSQCSDRLMFHRSDLDDLTTDKKNPHADDCKALKREVDRGGRGGGGRGGGGDPDGPGRGDEVDCAAQPWRPECRQTFTDCRSECTDVEGGAVCDVTCTEYAFSPGAGSGGPTTETGSFLLGRDQ